MVSIAFDIAITVTTVIITTAATTIVIVNAVAVATIITTMVAINTTTTTTTTVHYSLRQSESPGGIWEPRICGGAAPKSLRGLPECLNNHKNKEEVQQQFMFICFSSPAFVSIRLHRHR